MSIHTIQFGDEGQVATRELLKRFEQLRPEIAQGTSEAMGKLRSHLKALDAIDRQYGGSSPLPLEDADTLVDAAIIGLAHLESDCRQVGLQDASADIADLALGVALWAIRHGVAINPVDMVTNALATRSNLSSTPQQLAAVFGLMQGVIEHVKEALGADLERSNPARPWRMLHVNLAITAIRTEDAAMIDYAFDALDAALPDERAGFYSEALAIAMGPRISPVVRERVEARHGRWNLS